MTRFDRFDWVTSSQEAQLKMARSADRNELRRLARRYDWSGHPEAVLGWIMAQKSIDLGTALVVFFNGDPERFNYLSKREVPQAHRGAAWLLDNICMRVNSGFYRVRVSHKLPCRARLKTWLEFQQADREERRRGRWILDETIVSGALTGTRAGADGAPAGAATLRPLQRPAPMQGPMAGLIGGKLGRRLQEFLPRRD